MSIYKNFQDFKDLLEPCVINLFTPQNLLLQEGIFTINLLVFLVSIALLSL